MNILAWLLIFTRLFLPISQSVTFPGPGQPASSGAVSIALDNVSSSGGGTAGCGLASTCSWSHTITSASDGLLCVGVGIVDTGGPTSVSSITWNTSTSLTKIRRDVGTGGTSDASELWCALSAPTGTHTILVTLAAGPAQDSFGGGISLTGVHQSLTPDSQNGGCNATGQPGTSTTTVAANAWIIDNVEDNFNDFPMTPTSPQVQTWYVDDSGNSRGLSGSRQGPVATPGSKTMAWTALTAAWCQSVASWAPGP